MLKSRSFRYVVASTFGLLLLFGLWSAWQTWQVNKDLSEAVRHAEAIQKAVEDGDDVGLDAELTGLQEASSSAADRTSGITWAVLSKLPVFGDDAEGIEVTSAVLDDLARDGVEPLAQVSDDLDGMLPRDGAIDTDAVRAIEDPVKRAEGAFAEADAELARQDPSKFIGRLDKQFTEFRDQVSDASDAMRTARVATELLPAMLGGDAPQRYLLVFQNNAEIRGTGGLAGAISYIEADEGKLAIKSHLPASSLGEAPKSVLPLTKAEKDLYGDALGRYIVNAGMTPDVPRAADLLKARWEKKFPTQSVDGVVMVDAVAISYLLDATGPISVDGVQLTGANVVEELLHKSYIRLTEPDAQDQFFADVSSATFDKFTDGVGDSAGLIKALVKSADERRVFIHSFDADLQAEITGSAVAGDFLTDPEVKEPQFAVTLNDTTGAKMSYFLRYDVDVTATSCVDGVQSYAVKMRLRSNAPADAKNLPDFITGGGFYGIPPGEQVVTVRMFAPSGGKLGGLSLNGVAEDLIRVDQDGRPVGMTYIGLAPGQIVDLAWTMKSGKGQTGDTDVAVTPTIDKLDSAKTLASACAAEGR